MTTAPQTRSRGQVRTCRHRRNRCASSVRARMNRVRTEACPPRAGAGSQAMPSRIVPQMPDRSAGALTEPAAKLALPRAPTPLLPGRRARTPCASAFGPGRRRTDHAVPHCHHLRGRGTGRSEEARAVRPADAHSSSRGSGPNPPQHRAHRHGPCGLPSSATPSVMWPALALFRRRFERARCLCHCVTSGPATTSGSRRWQGATSPDRRIPVDAPGADASPVLVPSVLPAVRRLSRSPGEPDRRPMRRSVPPPLRQPWCQSPARQHHHPGPGPHTTLGESLRWLLANAHERPAAKSPRLARSPPRMLPWRARRPQRPGGPRPPVDGCPGVVRCGAEGRRRPVR